MKLEIESVRFKNFLSFGSAVQEIGFHQGVNVVLGQDVQTGRSNGSGKSSFLETIPFALFSKTHKEIKKEQLINWRSQRHCEVILDFKKGEDQYSVLRAIKPDNFEIYHNDSLVDRPAHVKDYQLVLEEILGQRFNTFGSLLHSNLNSSNRILDMKKPEKRRFIEDVFGLEIYSMLNEQARLKISSFDTKISDFGKDIEHNEISIKNSDDRIIVLNEKIKRFGSSEIELRDAKIELQEMKEKNPNLDGKIDGTQKEIDVLTGGLKAKQNIDLNISNRIRSVNRWFSQTQQQISEMELNEFSKQEFVTFCKEYGTPTEISGIISAKKDIQESLNQEQAEADERLKFLDIEVAKLEVSIKTEDLKLNNLVDHQECPTCGQTIQGKGKRVLGKIKNALKVMGKEHEILSNNTQLAKNACAILNKQRVENTAILVDVELKKEQLYKLKDKIKETGNKEQLGSKIGRYEKTISKLKLLADKIFTEHKQLGDRLNILGETKDNYVAFRNTIENKIRRVETLEKQIELEEKTKDEFTAMMATERASIVKLKAETDGFQIKQKTFNNIIDYLAVIRDVCKDERVKSYAISSIMPYINQQVNHYLSEVGYGFYCVIDKWLSAKIKGPGVRKATYGSLSGGEARGIDLAMQFALLDVARLQAGVWPDIVIMDEILDSSVDGKGIDKLMDIIKNKQQEESSKIFIISHRDEIGDEFNADHTYFVKKDGYSTVTML